MPAGPAVPGARDAGLETVVRFMGRLPNERPEVAAAADVFVLPSLAEGLSVALLEALSLGVPAVCSNVGDLGGRSPAGRTAIS